MTRWNNAFIKKVADEKEQYRGSSDLRNLLNLVTKSIYSDDIHYALELIQNAEDEFASRIDFKILPDKVIVYNDGETFDEGDVEAICSIKTGFKKNKIGFFGIGFKSVFNITDEPLVISDHFKFRIHECLYPEPAIRLPHDLDIRIPDPDRGALFILPIKKDKDPAKLVKELEGINDRLLLFLDNVQLITFHDETTSGKREWEIRKSQKDGIITIENTLLNQRTDWRVFSQKVKVPSDRPEVRVELKREVKQTNLVIAFPTPVGSEVPDLRSEFLYCYLPTKRRPDMPFLVQADFIPTLARENIEENNPWNLWLLEEIAKLASASYIQLREDKLLKGYLFKLIRLPGEVGDPLFKGVAEKILNRLKERAIAPINLSIGNWKKPAGTAFVPDDLRQLIRPGELRTIFGNNREPTDNSIDKRTHEVLSYLGIPEVGLSEVIDLLNKSEAIKEKGPVWFLDIYDYFAQQPYMIRTYYAVDKFTRLKNTPFLLTSDRKLVSPNDFIGTDRLLVQHPQTKNLGSWVKMFNEGELVFLDRYFQESKKDKRVKIDETLEEKRKRVKQFLENYEVAPSMRPYQIIQRVILPKFKTGKYKGYSDEKIVLFTNYLRENIRPYINRMRSQRKSIQTDEEAILEIREAIQLKGTYFENGSKKEAFFSPNDLYINNQSRDQKPIAKALQGINGVPCVSRIYYDRKITHGYTSVPQRGRRQEVVDWDDFFSMLGVWKQPRLKRIETINLGVSHYGKEWIPYYHYTRYNYLRGDKVLPDLEPLIAYYEGDRKSRQKQLCLFRDLIANSWEKVYLPQNHCIHDWFFNGDHPDTINETSFYHQLCENSWLPIEGITESLFQPNQVYLKNSINKSILPHGTPFIEVTDDTKSFYIAIGVKEHPDKNTILEHLQQIRHKWVGGQFPMDWAKRIGSIYQHLITSNKEEREGTEFKDIVRKFNENALIFLPSTRGNWWKPDQVFWEDCNDIFGDLRGYLKPSYNNSLKKIFEYVGVNSSASVYDCVRALEDLKIRWEAANPAERRPLKALVDRIYGELNRLLETPGESIVFYRGPNDAKPVKETTSNLLKKSLYLTDAEEGNEFFEDPNNIFYCDDERLRKIATGKVNLIWLQTDWHLYRFFFEKAGINPLSSMSSVEIIPFGPHPAISSEVNFLRELSHYLRPYLKYHHSKQFVQWDKGEALSRLEKIEVIATTALEMHYKINGKIEEVIPNVPAFYDKSVNTLYVIEHEAWLIAYIDYVSTELARVFEELGVPLKTQIESLLSGGFDEEARLSKFKSFGVPERVARDFIEPLQLRLREGSNKPSNITNPPENEPTPLPVQTTIKPVVAEPKPTTIVNYKNEELFNLEDIQRFIGEIDKHQSVVPISANHHRTKLENGQPRAGNGNGQPVVTKSSIGALETEALAITLVIIFEESNGREAADVHAIKNLGYDVRSTERYIEIKSFKGDAGPLSFEPSEWEAAEKYHESYYIYVVSNLLRDQIPQIRVIRNPYKYIGVYIPGKRIASNWAQAVSEDMHIVLEESTAEEEE